VARLRALLVVVWGALSVGACREDPAPVPRAVVPAASAIEWRSLGSWSGRGSRQTESFDVITGSLQLVWQTMNESSAGAGSLRVVLHSSISGRPLQTVLDTTGTGADTVYVADEPRVSYLLIESEGIDWRVTLEERVR
jgi:hypothetical protein